MQILPTTINDTDRQLASDPHNEELLQYREKIKQDLEVHAVHEAKSAQVRSRIHFIEDGERNTKYVLNLEKARADAKVMDRLKAEDGKILENQESIRQGCPFSPMAFILDPELLAAAFSSLASNFGECFTLQFPRGRFFFF